MKKLLTISILLAFVVTFTAPAFAYDSTDKLARGAEKVIKAPLKFGEFAKEEADMAKFKPWGFMNGLVKGTTHMVKNGVDGALDIITFPADLHE